MHLEYKTSAILNKQSANVTEIMDGKMAHNSASMIYRLKTYGLQLCQQ